MMLKKTEYEILIDKRPQDFTAQVFSVKVSAGANDLDAVRITHAMAKLYGGDNVTLLRTTKETVPVEMAFKAEGVPSC